jgi:hypothetical protein
MSNHRVKRGHIAGSTNLSSASARVPEALANGPKGVVVIEGRCPNNKAACQDLRLRMSPAGAIRAGELVTWFSA